MEDQIIERGPGYIIALLSDAHSLAPYAAVVHNEGINHGFIDLRDSPELAHGIPEAVDSPGMRSILAQANARYSELMTIGCEKGVFHIGRGGGHEYQSGGYIDMAFRDAACNTPDALITLARELVARLRLSEHVDVSYEFLVQPMKSFFGVRDRYALMLKPMGFGSSEEVAWHAFEVASQCLGNAIRQYNADQQVAALAPNR